MNLPEDFEAFLERLRLGEEQVRRITSATEALTDHLVTELAIDRSDVFIQGSYENGTAVKPDPEASDGEYDVDLVVVCARPDATPAEALAELRDAIAAHGRYESMIEADDGARPCVRVRYADDTIGGFHVDVVPARLVGPGSRVEIPHPAEGWLPSDPEAYSEWCSAQGDGFSRTVMVLKRWRDHNQKAHAAIKSIVLQVLVAQHMPQGGDDAERVAEALRGIADLVADHEGAPPEILNPVLPEENLAARWGPVDYNDFSDVVEEAALAAADALLEPGVDSSREKWGALLGSDFPSPGTGRASKAAGSREEHLDRDLNIPLKPAAGVAIRAEISSAGGDSFSPVDGRTRLPKGRNLRFTIATTTVAEPFDVYWKVRNTGKEAAAENALRGEIRRDDVGGRRAKRSEKTRYSGRHYVEIYLVKYDVCVARARRMVSIR